MSEAREAMFYEKKDGGAAACRLCHHACHIPEGGAGFCKVRENINGTLYASGYGKMSGFAIDPIEKKPLARFHPGAMVLSLGSYGCNLACPFCQNQYIAAPDESAWRHRGVIPPEVIVSHARINAEQGNIGLAYTYNEPSVGIEYILDCARLIHKAGLLNVMVTNGSLSREALETLLPYMDAMNIDLKAFTDEFYKKLSGDMQTVKETVALASGRCHVEVTTLVIPGENDTDEEIDALAKWLASVSPDIPLHLSRFFPQYKYADRQPTPRETILRLAEVAKRHCRYVYMGNMR